MTCSRRSSKKRKKDSSRKGDKALPTLVIAEKPSVARDLAKVLGARVVRPGCLVGNGYIVTWAAGHLLQLREPHDYDPKYKIWRLSDLPIIPAAFGVKPQPNQAQLKRIVALLQQPDVECVVNACDAGREGELIFRWIIEWAGRDVAVNRLWLSSLTVPAIKEAMGNLRPGSEFDALADAARCRAEADWLVGMNATRALSRKCSTLLSIGRVQTPTLALVVEREREIEEFLEETFFTITSVLRHAGTGFTAEWFDPSRKTNRVRTFEEAQGIVARLCAAGRGEVISVSDKEVTARAPLLYDLTELQRDMNVRYGFSAHRTLEIAQTLYERYKAITYPRTDSRHISGKTVPLVQSALSALRPRFGAEIDRVAEMSGGKMPFGRLIRESDVRDHHAILPTAATVSLSGDLARVYDAVATRLVAALFPPCVRVETEATIRVGPDTLRAKGAVTKSKGWREIYPGPEDSALPAMVAGDEAEVVSSQPREGKTRPKERHTDASLLRAMQTAGEECEDEAQREALKDKGLGTPATRAAIIERLIEVGYIFRQGRYLAPAAKGKSVIRIIPAKDLVSPSMTGGWEMRLANIEKREMSRASFMGEMAEFVSGVVATIKAMKGERLTDEAGICPKCGGTVEAHARSYECRACGFIIPGTIAGKRLLRQHVTALLSKGKTALMHGFRSKTGGRFRAYLVLGEDQTIRFEFPKRRRPTGKKAKAKADEATE